MNSWIRQAVRRSSVSSSTWTPTNRGIWSCFSSWSASHSREKSSTSLGRVRGKRSTSFTANRRPSCCRSASQSLPLPPRPRGRHRRYPSSPGSGCCSDRATSSTSHPPGSFRQNRGLAVSGPPPTWYLRGPQMSRLRTFSALSSMKFRRDSTSSPIRTVNALSASSTSPRVT